MYIVQVKSTRSLSMAIAIAVAIIHLVIAVTIATYERTVQCKWHGSPAANGCLVHYGNQYHMHLTVNEMN